MRKVAMHISSKKRSSDCDNIWQITQQSTSKQITACDNISHSRAGPKFTPGEGLKATSCYLPSAGMQKNTNTDTLKKLEAQQHGF